MWNRGDRPSPRPRGEIKRDGRKASLRVMGGKGSGAHPGQGRVDLVDLVLAGLFNAANARHREKLRGDDSLLELAVAGDDPNADTLERLRRLQLRFRHAETMGKRSETAWASQEFARLVGEIMVDESVPLTTY